MADVLIFGGTTEGRRLAEVCASLEIDTCVCVVSGYGERLLPGNKYIRVYTGARDQAGMEQLLTAEHPQLVFDATHPYAAAASSNAAAACQNFRSNLGAADFPSTGSVYQRVLRSESSSVKQENEIWVNTIAEAVPVLAQDDRPVLVTTGSKELKQYAGLERYQERIYARVLPSREGISACEELGISGRHVIAVQGPFGQLMNEAMLKHVNAGWLVTKESGSVGGFIEKVEAARALGVKTIVIGRPKKEEGISLEEACRQIAAMGGPEWGEIFLIGIGMGSQALMTGEAIAAIHSCDALLGAARMLKAAEPLNDHAETGTAYLPEAVLAWIKSHPWLKKIGILLSGDTGFYSGAKAFKTEFDAESPPHPGSAESNDRERQWRIRMLPGISTVSYFCARLGTNWEDVHLCSTHGRICDLIEKIQQYPRVFCLLGGKQPVQELCRQLQSEMETEVTISAGEYLSYPQERIATGSPEEIGSMDFGGLAAVLIERNTGNEG